MVALLIGGDRVTAGAGETGAGPGRNGPETTAPGTAAPRAPEPVVGSSVYPMSLTTGGAWPVTASWTYVDGLEGLNAQLDSWLLAVLDAKAEQAGGPYRPAMALNALRAPEPQPKTTLTARPVEGAGTTLVFRETEIDTAPDAAGVSTSRTIYADTATGGLHSAAELLRPESIPVIQAMVTGTSEQHGGPKAGAAGTSDGAQLQDMVLDADGALEVTGPGPQTVPSPQTEAGTGVKVSIDPLTVEGALSNFGRGVLTQLRSHSPVALPPPAGPGLRHINCDLLPCAALTYDDGPDPKTTPQLLGILKDKNIQATFFMLGNNAAANSGLARQVTDAGHIAGNHTFSHPHLGRLSTAGIKSEIGRAGAAIFAATGTTPAFMRPPYGDANAAVLAAVGLPLILWSVDSLDWQSRNPAIFIPKVLKEIKPGAVVLMHDIQPTTVAGQVELISSLQAQGYYLVTVPQLFQGTPLAAGQVYRSRPERK